jgi:hypothetical protein
MGSFLRDEVDILLLKKEKIEVHISSNFHVFLGLEKQCSFSLPIYSLETT